MKYKSHVIGKLESVKTIVETFDESHAHISFAKRKLDGVLTLLTTDNASVKVSKTNHLAPARRVACALDNALLTDSALNMTERERIIDARQMLVCELSYRYFLRCKAMRRFQRVHLRLVSMR